MKQVKPRQMLYDLTYMENLKHWKKKKKPHRKLSDLWLPEVAGGGGGRLDEDGQRVQTSSNKISKF